MEGFKGVEGDVPVKKRRKAEIWIMSWFRKGATDGKEGRTRRGRNEREWRGSRQKNNKLRMCIV